VNADQLGRTVIGRGHELGHGGLEPILGNRFGRNLRITPNSFYFMISIILHLALKSQNNCP
jgi:hypothetical protein